ncbi:TonB-dependent receptor [Nitrospirillum iridis]|uniref:Iron complex outermembrane receptor protein n=1 Tax=Nitrospirillum iridis TaxID=765888 RepID=A0A7X0EDE0_9PROT|nr:TonB-dependent receptor [Nitrospirillum iridis]MBB6250951.1 iron complex outermembrane receptor protein [Nitrospirillum iridis]
MKKIPAGLLLLLCTTCSSLALAADLPAPDGTPTALSDIIVIGTTPLPGANVPLDKLPASATTLSADDFAHSHSISILDAMAQRVPGLSLSDSQGNALFQDLHFHGFTVSPLQGTSQGIAVYQNGVRLNEAFGDTVNWDLAPEVAINRLTLATNNPAYGLNALGGAVTLEMKNGFTFQGTSAELLGGSNGRVQGSAEFGYQSGNFSLYLAGEAARDDGWRKQSASDVERFYADAGWRGEGAELHLIAAAARSSLGVVGPTPLEMIQADETAVYTWPQTTKNDSGMLALNGKVDIAAGWAVQGNVYGRHFGQKHVDGNDSNFERCSARSSYGGKLCLEDDAFGTPAGGKTTAFRNQFVITDLAGHTFAYNNDATYGTLDRTATDTTGVGGSLQLTGDRPLLRLGNRFVAGGSIDHSDIRFTATSTLGVINPDLSVTTQGGDADEVAGAGLIIRTLGNLGYAPVWLSGTTDFYGAYVTDTLDLTPALSLTAGLRLNVADISMRDRGGSAPELNSDNRYTHLNPQAGLTYRLGDGVSVYGGYSQSNRAPTPLELDCADPLRPCLLENSLVADPPLRQVVAETYEAGIRGVQGVASGRLDWTVGLFRTDSDHDILALASTIQGRGYYTNVPSTRRQGVDAGLTYARESWQVYLNYSFVDATYQFDGVLASPNNPSAADDGTITVHSGARMPGIPRHQVKLGGDLVVTDAWSVGGAVQYYGSQYLVGDDANQNSPLTPYWTMNLRTSYQVLPNIQFIGGINNLFDRRYASYGTYFEVSGASDILGRTLSDARTLTLGAPRTFYGGVKVTF